MGGKAKQGKTRGVTLTLTIGLMSSNREDWPTPAYLFFALDQEFHFTLDVCANEDNHKVTKYFSKEIDGLKQDWSKDVSFMNPPYGDEIPKWVKKAKETAMRGGVVVGLLPARTDTKWWGDVMTATELRFIKGRVTFEGAKGCAPFPSVIAIWGTPHTPVIKTIDNTLLKSQYNTLQKGKGKSGNTITQKRGNIGGWFPL